MFFVNMAIPGGRIMSPVIPVINFRSGFLIVSFRIIPGWFEIIPVPVLITVIMAVMLGPVIIRPGQAPKHKNKGCGQ